MRKMAASGGCKLLDKLSAKRLIDSVDTVLTDCDGIYCVGCSYYVSKVEQYQLIWQFLVVW